MDLGVHDLDVGLGHVGARHDLRAGHLDAEHLRLARGHLDRELLDVEQDVDSVLLHARDLRLDVLDSVDPYPRHGRPGYDREQRPSERVTDGQRIALFEGLGDEAAVPVGHDLPLDPSRPLKWNTWHSLPCLFAVELDDELLGDRDLDVVAQRQAADHALLLVRIELQPLGHLPAAGVHVIVETRLHFGRRTQLDRVAHLHQERRYRDLPSVHLEMAVRHHLATFTARGGEAEPMHDVVEPELEEPQEILAGDALLGLGPLEVLAELALQHAVDALGLLLFAELDAEGGRLAAVQPMLARRIVAAFDRALVGEAARTLQEQFLPFAAAQPALRVTIARHGRLLHPPPLRRPAPVVRNRRHVADRGDLETGGLQRADGRLAPSSGASHEHLDLLQAVLHRLAGRQLGGRLRGEGRALTRALEPGAPGARPGHDVPHPVRERDDRVVERRLDVGDAGADFAPLAPLGALLSWCGFRFFGHALRSRLLRRCCRRCRRGRRRRRRRLLLDHHAPLGALPRAGIGVGPLSAHRETAAMTDAAIGADVHQALDVHRDVAPQVTFDLELALDDLADPVHLVVGPR